ncbi:calcium-independent phospholipase A2-gamma, partial [Rhizoctonia solani 123E]
MQNEREESKGLNILCIGNEMVEDGGGVRGLSCLIILQEVMRRVADAKGNAGAQPHEHFDVIAGAGTGGISACMLGRLRMPVDKAIAEYAKLVKEVFKEKKMNGPTMYKGTKLQQALNAMIREATGDEGERMIEDQKGTECKTVVFAMARHNLIASLPVLFRSYTVTTNPGPDCTIREALYATMAHPDLFKPIDIIDSSVFQSFVGGELGCSNPLAHVLSEVKRIYPDRQVACIISIGAGHARTIRVPTTSRWHRTQDVIVMKDMARDSERVAEEMMGRFEGTGAVYIRFNVDQGMQNMKDGSWERIGEAMQHTKAYLQKHETGHKLEEAVRASTERRGAVTTAHAAGQISRIPDAVFTRCPAPTPFYTGREQENTQLITCITGAVNELRVCVVYGLGGVGKTQLLLNVIERTWNEWDHIIFVDASSAGAIEKELTAFGKANKTGDAYTAVIRWLETCGKRWLVAFDNADTASTNLRQYIPARGRGSSALITTRLPDLARLARGPGSTYHLSSMSQSDGAALLAKLVYSGGQPVMDDDITATDQLVKDFGGLALAIVHAGAYIAHSPGMTIAKYRLLFMSRRQRILDEYNKLPPAAKLDEHGDTVYTTWRVCYDQLQLESRELLWLIAYLHYDGIFEDMFKRAAQNMHSQHYPLPLTDLQLQAQR